MSVLTQGNYLADWLVEEFGAPSYCRAEKVVLVDQDMDSGMCLGVHTLTPALYPYDNSAPASVTGILIEPLQVNDAMLVTSMTDAANTCTVVTPENHGLATGDTIKVTGATVDTALNGFYAVTVTGVKGFTFTSAALADAAYTESTLRITKVNQAATCLVRGPATIVATGLSFAAGCNTAGEAAALVDIAAFSPAVKILEAV